MTASKKKVLLVEDDKFLNKLYLDLLTSEGYKVSLAEDGASALEKIQSDGWDLILLDVILPKMNGFEIFDKLDKSQKNHCPIIFMTNLDSSDKDKAKLEKADEYWIKSDMSPPDFIKKVKSVLK